MTRSAPIAIAFAVSALASTASAQGDGPGVEAAPEALEVGVTGLPGGDRIGYAESLPAGTLSTAFSAGYGVRSGLLASGHSMSRGAATAALAYSITDDVSVGLLLDGRYDKHTGTGFADDGWVGEPRLHLRAGKRLGTLGVGGELTVWTPGRDAPSIVPAATSVDARGLLTVRLASGIRIAANAGFRLDNSAKSVTSPMALSAPDQASLGVSQWHAIVAGGRVAVPTGRITLGLEAELHLYVGGPALPATPTPSLAIGAVASYRISRAVSAELFLVTNIQDKPVIAADGTIALIPYAPLFGGGVGVTARFGGPRAAPVGSIGTGPTPSTSVTASLSGQITDDTGAPLASAVVTITDAAGKVVTVTTDGAGRFRGEGLQPGDVTVVVEATGRVARTSRVRLKEGGNDAPITALAPVVPPGRLRFVIRSFATNKGIDAEVEVSPGGHKLEIAADGSTELDIAPGTYTVKVRAPNHKEQTREYVVDKKSVVIVNVDLRK